MSIKQVFNPLSGNFDTISQVELAPVGSSPNPNAATITTNQILNLELADASNPGLISSSQFNILSNGNPRQMVAYNSVGVLSEFPGYFVDQFSGGINGNLNYDPNDSGVYRTINTFFINVTPTIVSPGDSVINTQLGMDLDPSNTGIGFGTNGLASRMLDVYTSSRSSAAFGSINGINVNLNMGDSTITGGSADGLSAIDLFVGSDQGFTVTNGVRGVNLSSNFIAGSSIVGGFSGIGSDINIRGSVENSINYFQATGTFNPTSFSNGGICHFGAFTQQYSTTTNVQGFASSPNFETTANTQYYVGFSDTPNTQLGSTFQNYNGINISPNLVNANLTGELTGININLTNINPSTITNNVTGLKISTINANLSNGVPSRAIDSNGLHGFFAKFEPASTYSGFFQLNNLGGLLHTLPGQPINNTFGFINNLASLFLFEDNIGPDPSGFDLGVTGTGFVGQVAGALGKTVDTINFCASGASVPSSGSLPIPSFTDGGTVSNVNLFTALGVLPAGGNLNITNLKAFKVGPNFTGISPTNAWGISVEDANAENYLAKSLAIGTSSTKVSAPNIGLEILTKDVLLDGGTLTSSQIIDNGLTPNTAVYADSNKQLTSSSTTNVELGYLSGATSNIQAQINALVPPSGDISETTFNSTNNQSSPVNVTGLVFNNATVRAAKVLLSVSVQATSNLYEMFELQLIQRDSNWAISATSVGDSSGYVFSVTNLGQVQYTNLNYAGFVSAPIHFRAQTLSV